MSTSRSHSNFRQLGSSGLTVSAVGLGCNNLGKPGTATESLEGSTALIDAALESGVTFFDTSDTYGGHPGLSEDLLGRALGRQRREDVVVATKFGMDMRGANGQDFGARGSRRYVVKAVEASLRRLGTDWIDLLQFHYPDPKTPIGETLSAMDDLVRAGKVRYIGNSNMSGWQIAEAEFTARMSGGAHFVSAQNHYNLLSREVELEVLPAVRAFGLSLLPFFPLASGLLTGKYTRTGDQVAGRISDNQPQVLDSAPWDRLEAYTEFARARGLTELTVAISWLAAQPGVASVMAGATTPEQIRANVAAAGWDPTAEDLAEIDVIFPRPKPLNPF